MKTLEKKPNKGKKPFSVFCNFPASRLFDELTRRVLRIYFNRCTECK